MTPTNRDDDRAVGVEQQWLELGLGLGYSPVYVAMDNRLSRSTPCPLRHGSPSASAIATERW